MHNYSTITPIVRQQKKNGTPIPHTCQICGEEFLAHESAKRLYCSQKCYWESKKKTEHRTCPICEKTFEVWPSEPNRFCSLACRDKAQEKRDERICKQCEKAFTVHPHRKDIYCSRDCAHASRKGIQTAIYPVRVCEKCGKEFEHKRRDTSGKYCSRACSDSVNKNPPAQEWISKSCAYCEELFLCPPWNQTITHCSNKCASRHTAETMQGVNHPLWKDKIEMTCEVCGKICQIKPSLVSRFRACSRSCTAVLSAIAQQGRSSSIEIKMQEAMNEAGLFPTPQYIIGPFIADFAFIKQKLVIECDGDYWHSLPERQAKDRQKDGYLKKTGWHIIRLSETDIKLSATDCVARIQDKLQSLMS